MRKPAVFRSKSERAARFRGISSRRIPGIIFYFLVNEIGPGIALF
jgi:hypothetical protein